jgi:ERCC4-type nuclease
MEIIIDNREQLPYSDDVYKPLGIKCTFATLPIGDYSIKGKEKEVAIERKALDDFIHSITFDRVRFERELEKAKSYKRFIVVVEGDFEKIKAKQYYSNTDPKSIFGTAFKWMIKYNIPIIFVSNREGGALATFKMLEACEQYGI